MKQVFLFIYFLVIGYHLHGQYLFEGQLTEDASDKTVYLSVIEDYRKLSRVYMEQIFRKTVTDSLGYFHFEGSNLPKENRIYRIHIDNCTDSRQGANHVFNGCSDTKSITFIAHNRDTITFPKTFANEVLCDISSTNPKSDLLLQIDRLKEEMAFDFSEFRSAANRKLNTKKWFEHLQRFGQQVNEPLAELYIYDFLSDRRNETYTYYLKDLAQNDYYADLESRLRKKYGNTVFTRLYADEIAVDGNLRALNGTGSFPGKWIFAALLSLSILLNLFLFVKGRRQNAKPNEDKLTTQERKIVDSILNDKTNKEIATDLFISHSTVKTHINNLYKKMNVSSRDEIKSLFMGHSKNQPGV